MTVRGGRRPSRKRGGERDGRFDRANEFALELDRLKRRGSTVLVVGDVPDRVFDQLSARFLGAGPSDRARVFVLAGRSVDAVRRRLTLADASFETVHVVRAGSPPDGSSTADPIRSGPNPVSLLDRFDRTVDSVIRDRNGLGRGELRVCVDSLNSFLDQHDSDTVEWVLRTMRETIVGVRGIGHCLLPRDRTAILGGSLQEPFDAVVEVDVRDGRAVHRWRLVHSRLETRWLSIEDPEDTM